MIHRKELNDKIMLKRFTKYVTQSVAGMIGISIYVLADTFFISVYSGADGLCGNAGEPVW